MGKAKATQVNPLTAKIEYNHGWHYDGAALPLPIDLYKVHKYGNVGNAPFEVNAELGRDMIETYVAFNVSLVNELKKIKLNEKSLV